MGLLGDTLRDARRPIAGTWVRRSPDDAEALPDEMPDTGMQTVFRFQKGDVPAVTQVAAREASPRPVAGSPVVPAADPLSVGAEVGTSEPLAKNVNGNEGISVFLEVSRTSELATGQVRHASPGKMAAANAKSESGAYQSEVTSERLETEPYREPHKSNIPEGSERLVSENGETSGSRPSGRGASPSETLLIDTTLSRAAAHPSPLKGEGPGERGIVGTREHVPAIKPAMSPSVPAPTRGGGLARETSPYAQQSAPSTPRPRPPATPRPRAPEPAPPSLVIGRIDVVVVADAPTRSQPAARPDTGYLSRNYLKRL